MRKTLLSFLVLAAALGVFLLISYQKKEFVSLKNVTVVPYGNVAHNQNMGEIVRFAKDGKWGVAKKHNGEVLIKPEYEDIDNFYEGYAVIKKDDKYGAVDEQFNIVIEPTWDYMSQFHLGYAVVMAKNKKFGVIDVNGKIIIKPLYYDYISSFDDNFVANAKNIKDGKDVLIDLRGNVIQ